ncbi:MAG: alpha/beta fold hydrolase [Sphingobacteriales bacterium]|nr:alpha/beta fold hydrolase [Sphingobacteriales bacterium]
MKGIDVIFLVLLTTTTSWLILLPRRIPGILKLLTVVIILLALAQFLIYGFYWHYLPGYLLILSISLMAVFSTNSIGKLKLKLLQFFLLLLLIAALLPWSIFLPVPELTKPQGDYKVGTRIFRWVDSSRAEQLTSDLTDKRNVVVQAWYPTEENAKGSSSAYLDGLGSLPEKVGILPRWILDHYDQINTYGVLNAPISKAQAQWPVILFLTGNGASRAFYTSLVAGLASHGYVVLAIDHPYEAMLTQLADGKIVTTIEDHRNDGPDLTKFMEGRLETRIADIQFVLDQLDHPDGPNGNFFLALDKNRIVIAGHSLGGASAAAAMAFDSRIKAAANIDGTLYGDLPKPNGAHPFLLIESKKDGSERYRRYENGNQKFFKQFGGGYRYEIPEADHYSFTDAPLLLALPARFFSGRFLQFGHIPKKTQNATVDILTAFFSGALANNLTDLDSVANRYQGIIRKPVN